MKVSGRKYDVITQNGVLGLETKSAIKMQRRYRIQYRQDPLSDNAIQHWLKHFQETGTVLRRKREGRLGTSQEVLDRIKETFSRSPQNSTTCRGDSLQLGISQTTVRRVNHNHLHFHSYKVQLVQNGEFHTLHAQLKICHGNIFQLLLLYLSNLLH
jgi:hypothetical protein